METLFDTTSIYSKIFIMDVDSIKQIIGESSSISEVCTKLNFKNNGYSFKKIKKIINDEKINVSHFKRNSHRKYDIDLLKQAVIQSTTYSEICRFFNIKETGGNIKTIKNRLIENNIDISHFNGKGWNKGKRQVVTFKERNLSEVLIENSTCVNTHHLKNRLIKSGLLENKCSNDRCSVTNMWNGEKISLHLDHINGNRSDCRIKNLRLLCPNCHSQTETYAGKKNKK